MKVREVAIKIAESNPRLCQKAVYKTLVELSNLSTLDFKYINAVHTLTLKKKTRLSKKLSCTR